MSDIIEKIKRRTAKEYERLSIAINGTDKFTKQGILDCIKELRDSSIEIIDEELAKEPQECKMRDATAEEQKYTQAKIDKIKEPQKCEWNRQGAEDFIITGCGHRPYKVIIDNCGFKIDFCPYCGRKVKVIE